MCLLAPFPRLDNGGLLPPVVAVASACGKDHCNNAVPGHSFDTRQTRCCNPDLSIGEVEEHQTQLSVSQPLCHYTRAADDRIDDGAFGAMMLSYSG